MTNEEFVQVTSRLEKYFDKEYKAEQAKEMYNMLKDWNMEKYVKTVSYCIRNCKYLPKLADITNADISTVRTQSNKVIDFIKCNKCNGEGFIKYFKQKKDGDRILKYEYIALCTCQNAEKQRQINKYNLPTLAELGLQGVAYE